MEPSSTDPYWDIIRRRFWLIVLLVACTVVGVIAGSLLQPRVYQTTIRFQVTSPPPTDVVLYQASRSGTNDLIAATRANFIETLTSLDVAWRVVKTLGLPLTGRELLANVNVRESADSDFVLLTVTAQQPQQAADIANTLMAEAIASYGELNAQPLTLAREFLAEQLDLTQAELAQAQADLIAFRAAHGLGTLDAAVDAQVSLIRSLQLAHDQAVAESDQAAADKYDQLLAQRRQELLDLIQLSSENATLQTRVGQTQDTYTFLLEKMTEARIKENQARKLDFIQVLGQARIPDTPEPQIKVTILALGIALSTALGIMLAFVWEYLARHRPQRAAASPVARQFT